MSRSELKKAIVGVTAVLLLVVCFQATPISISSGQNALPEYGNKRYDLYPGQRYMVYTDRPINLPGGVWLDKSCGISSAFRHGDFGKDKEKKCAGHIAMVLKNDGSIEYQCVLCKQTWIRNAEGKISCCDKN